jgi:hypothetical protein
MILVVARLYYAREHVTDSIHSKTKRREKPFIFAGLLQSALHPKGKKKSHT